MRGVQGKALPRPFCLTSVNDLHHTVPAVETRTAALPFGSVLMTGPPGKNQVLRHRGGRQNPVDESVLNDDGSPCIIAFGRPFGIAASGDAQRFGFYRNVRFAE